MQYKQKWIAFFDILGFKKFVEKSNIDNIELAKLIIKYHTILNELKKKCTSYPGNELSYLWFSDSFIFYTKDGSAQSYTVIQQAAKFFLQKSISHHVPLRGAISFGNLYTEDDNKIIIGPALIDAYLYSEAQEWINLLLTPTASRKVIEFGLKPQHHNFIDKGIKLNNDKLNKLLSRIGIYAYTYCSGQYDSDSYLIKPLREMQRLASTEKDKTKYENTIVLIQQYHKKIK